jgi:hypothetical protein
MKYKATILAALLAATMFGFINRAGAQDKIRLGILPFTEYEHLFAHVESIVVERQRTPALAEMLNFARKVDDLAFIHLSLVPFRAAHSWRTPQCLTAARAPFLSRSRIQATMSLTLPSMARAHVVVLIGTRRPSHQFSITTISTHPPLGALRRSVWTSFETA